MDCRRRCGERVAGLWPIWPNSPESDQGHTQSYLPVLRLGHLLESLAPILCSRKVSKVQPLCWKPLSLVEEITLGPALVDLKRAHLNWCFGCVELLVRRKGCKDAY